MYADLDRLARGRNHTDTAADHVRAARERLQSVEVTAGMFGRTEGAANAEIVVSRNHERHVRALDDRHRSLTWIGEQTTGITTDLPETDRAGGGAVRAAGALDGLA